MKKLFVFGLVMLFLISFVSAIPNNVLWHDYNATNETEALFDWSGTGNDGLNYGATFSSTHFDFNGIEYLNISDPTNLSFTYGSGNDSSLTINCWAKIDTSGSFRILMSKYEAETDKEWYVALDNSNKPILDLFDSTGGSNYIGESADSGLSTGQDYMITTTYDGSKASTGINIYVNGSLVASSPRSGGTYNGMEEKNIDVLIAAREPSSPELFFNGDIYGCQIWNESKNSTYILNLYDEGRAYNPYENIISNFTITAQDIYTNASINNFSVDINGSTYFSNNTGSIETHIYKNDTNTYNFTVFNATGYYNKTLTDINVSTDYTAYLVPVLISKNVMDFAFDSIQVVEDTTYQNFYYGEFTGNTEQSLLLNQIEVYSETNGSYYCRNNINNSYYGSEFYFNTIADEITTLKFLSDEFSLTNDKYTLQLDCKKLDSSQPDLYIIQYAGFMEQSESLNVDKSNFTTTGESYFNIDYEAVSTTTRLIHYDGFLYFEDNDGLIQTTIDYDGVPIVYNTTDEYLYFSRLLIPTSVDGNITTTFTTNFTGVVNYQIGYTESIIFDTEYDSTRDSLPFQMTAADYANVTSMTPVSNSVFVHTDLSFNSNETQDIGIKLWSVDEEYIFTRTVNEGNYTLSVFGLFENVSNDIYLQAYATEQNATLIDYNLTQHNVTVTDLNKDELLIYAFDGYKNETLENLSAWIYGSQYKTEDGELKLYVKSDEVDFIFGSTQNGGYVNRTYNDFNTSNYLNSSFYQTNITLIFKHSTTNQTITKTVGVTDVDNSYYFNTNLSNNTFNFPLDLTYLLVNASNYVAKNESVNFTLGEVSTIYITLSPIINFSFYDERTNLPFNMSSPDEIKVQVICSDVNETIEQVITNATDTLNLTCDYSKIRFNVDYGVVDGSYYRTYPNLETVFGVDDFTFRVWLLDLDTTNVIYNSFRVYDLFGDYDNPYVLLYKVIGDNEWLITGDRVDAESKISAFLIQNDEYTIKVLSDNQPERVMGSYFAALAGETTIRLFEISLDSQLSEFSSQVTHYIYLVNDSGVKKVRGAVNDTGSNVQNVRFVVKETDDSGVTICDQTSSTNNVEFSCDVNSSSASYFYSKMYITDTSGNERLNDKIMKGSEVIPLPFEFESETTQNYFFLFMVLVVGFSATMLTAPTVALLLIGFIAFLRTIGWFKISQIASSSSSGNLAIASAFIMITALISVLYFIRRGKK